MHQIRATHWRAWAAAGVATLAVGCAVAATTQAFDQLHIRQTKVETAQDDAGERREINGTADDRDIAVTLKPEGKSSTRVQVVAKKSAVTWDKDFARAVLDKIVAFSH